jgi:protein-disulfide isomerase
MLYYIKKLFYFFVCFFTLNNFQTNNALAEIENYIGNKDSNVTVIEYASMTCGHCATFHNKVFPKLKEKYIETGKIKFIYRDFPLDQQALHASILARCAPKEKYFDFLELIFNTQEKWISGKDEFVDKLTNIGQMGGLSENQISSCFRNENLVDLVIDNRSVGEKKYNINSTPSFIINEKKFTAMSFKDFEKVLDNLLDK